MPEVIEEKDDKSEITDYKASVIKQSFAEHGGAGTAEDCIYLEALTGPQCLIDEIDDFEKATIGLLKDALIHCLSLPPWI